MVKHGAEGADHRGAPASRSRRFFDRHGGKAILIGRFVGLVRAIAPFLAGSSGMPLRRFVPYDVIGAGLWGSTLRPARLRLLAELQPARRLREEGRARAGRGHRARGRDRVARPLAARRATTARACASGSSARPSGRRCARWRACCAPVLRTTRRPGALRLGPRDPGRPRPRAHDAVRGRRRRGLRLRVGPRRASSRTTACSSATPRRCGWPTACTWTRWSTWPRS